MSSRQKHIPQRTCIICREVKPKRSLIRLVRTPDEGVQIDPTRQAGGAWRLPVRQPGVLGQRHSGAMPLPGRCAPACLTGIGGGLPLTGIPFAPPDPPGWNPANRQIRGLIRVMLPGRVSS